MEISGEMKSIKTIKKDYDNDTLILNCEDGNDILLFDLTNNELNEFLKLAADRITNPDRNYYDRKYGK